LDLIEKNQNEPLITYCEKKIGKTLYRVTNVYIGKIDFAEAMEDLIIRKILRDDGANVNCKTSINT